MDDEKTPVQTVLNLGGWSTNTVLYVALGVFLLGAAIGAWGYHTVTDSAWLTKLHNLQMELTKEKNKPPIIKEVVKTVTNTEVAYVPKETVIYRDSKTGRELTAQEIDSMNLNVRPSDFYFTVNGKPQKFSKTDEERWVFDKNKLAINQTSTASVEIKVPIEDRTRRTAIIPSALYSSNAAKAEFGGIFVQQLGRGKVGLAVQGGAFSGGYYTIGVGGSF